MSDTSNTFYSSSPSSLLRVVRSDETVQHAQSTNSSRPRYVTRQTSQEMARQSEALTHKELAKLEKVLRSATATSASYPTTPTQHPHTDTRLHEMMCKYADKQQEMCTQICTLNQRLQVTQDQCFELKDTHQKEREELETERDHLKEVSSGYEDDLDDLQQQYDEISIAHTALVDDHTQLQSVYQTRVASFLWVGVTAILCMSCMESANDWGTNTMYDWLTEPVSYWLDGLSCMAPSLPE